MRNLAVYLEADSCSGKMKLLIHSAKQVVTITNQDVNVLSGPLMTHVHVLENDIAIAVQK